MKPAPIIFHFDSGAFTIALKAPFINKPSHNQAYNQATQIASHAQIQAEILNVSIAQIILKDTIKP